MENVDQDQQNNEVIRQAQFAGTQENNNQVQVRDKISPISCKAKISCGAPPTISLDQAEKKNERWDSHDRRKNIIISLRCRHG